MYRGSHGPPAAKVLDEGEQLAGGTQSVTDTLFAAL